MKILKCLAWVIGINEYMHYPDLHAAVNDATEFADKLELLGYSVVRSIDDGRNQDGTYRHILEKQQIFLDKILEDKVDVALVYFAGHGLMINKEDCLILSDTDSCNDGIVKARGNSINLNRLCKDMNANGDQMNLLIMDACRGKAEMIEVGLVMTDSVVIQNFLINLSLHFLHRQKLVPVTVVYIVLILNYFWIR